MGLLGGGYYAYNQYLARKPVAPLTHSHHANGWQAYKSLRQQLLEKNDGPVYEYFVSGKKPNGEMWCPDCASAQKVVEDCVSALAPPGSHFLETSVGPMAYWKNQSNEFRTQADVNCVPLLRRVGRSKFL